MKIGKIKLDGSLVLAPMASITDLPFRIICREYGASLVYSEMINADSLSKNSKSTEKLYLTSNKEKPVSFQLFGLKKETIVNSIKKIEDKCDIIDLNIGCPASQIIGSGAGAALLKKPEKIGEIIRAMVNATSKPITAKMRLGYDKNNAINIAKIIEDNGAEAIAIHGRTYNQGYTGKSDWNAIKEVTENVNIPIIGNGDVKSGIHAKKLLKFCKGVMIGRAAIGDPFIFKRINYFLEKEKNLPMPTINEKIDTFLEYCTLAQKYNCINHHTLMQKAQDFTKNLREAKSIRSSLNSFKEIDDIIKYMNNLKK